MPRLVVVAAVDTILAQYAAIVQLESITEPVHVMVAKAFFADQCVKVKATVVDTIENAL